MYVYVDPDYTGHDTGHFHWRRTEPRW
jgi:hypothetical protein